MPSVTTESEPDAPSEAEDRVLTLPNLITLVRLSCLPVFLWLLFGQEDRVWAASLLGALGATDWVDGFIARRWDQVSTVGKVFDPVADRLLFFVGGVAIIIDGSIPLWVAGLVLGREVVVTLATLGLAAAGARRIDVTWCGKAGTFFLMWAFPMFLASNGELFWRDQALWIAWATTVPGLVLAYIALALYVPLGLRAVREGRAERITGPPDQGTATAR
ncbi:CDP-alcohol phosphatidyltransferase family protein [Iamia sp.]|uniref:CDP-alcohol phosphatidyltransferase family protein n=1 Tax=Iamia sp. TaxID=2722710 RepID=UPI002C37A1F7|nr:CDP-alcohol phosphatidyltransferase family protein [Iamia sp.]HXH57215.1 CDP-alcohol phosphatidyltransferase family protein [Iamia sp.]